MDGDLKKLYKDELVDIDEKITSHINDINTMFDILDQNSISINVRVYHQDLISRFSKQKYLISSIIYQLDHATET